MDCYEVWVDLARGTNDLEFVASVSSYLNHLKERGDLDRFRIRRRKFGFGPEGLGEFNITMEFSTLSKLDAAFQHVATREDPVENLHREVFSVVTNFKSALYRDFPDPVRKLS